MLHTFLATHRLELIARCQVKALRRPSRAPLSPGLQHGIPLFLDQLIATLRLEQMPDKEKSERVSGAAGGLSRARSEVGEAAALHGRELHLHGFTVDEVVHDYGDLCQAVTELAEESGIEIKVDEFHTLNRCLDNAIADAVREYSYGEKLVVDGNAEVVKAKHAFFVHELRNMLHTALLAFSAVRSGKVTPNGATGDVLDRSLRGLSALVERSVSELRNTEAAGGTRELVPLAEFIGDSYRAGALAAEARGCKLVVTTVDPSLAIEVDRDLAFGALANLLTNAFKYTYHGTEVTLGAFAVGDRIRITVTDQCGGVPPDTEAKLFVPFKQGSGDRSGLGLGLSITRKYVEASLGTVEFRNVPGKGCVFTMEFPRHQLPEPRPLEMA